MSKKERKKKKYDDDDGRTISDMNVEGMPWYNGRRDEKHQPGTDKEKQTDASVTGGNEEKITLSRKEGLAMMRGVLLAAMLVGGIFLAVFALFILFCIYIWFK
jgi:hypothetical protein